ncbi:MAG: hydrogenase iron-sulfur subunit [Candidatus Helarchaeota archaeon]
MNIPELKEKIKQEILNVDILFVNSLCVEHKFQDLIKTLQTNTYKGFVFAGCTPQIIEMKINIELRKNGLNGLPFEIANIREQCSWVHDIENANYKAYILIKSHLNKLRNKKKIEIERKSLDKSITIIGGGIAGLQIASNLQKYGYKIYLIEKKLTLGGRVSNLPIIHPYKISGIDFVNKLIDSIDFNKIKLYQNYNIEWIAGDIGNYSIKLKTKSNNSSEIIIKSSLIVFTTGHDIYQPDFNDFYKYNVEERVITLFELGLFLKDLENDNNKISEENNFLRIISDTGDKKRILFIQCVGSRDKNYYEYCSKYCCTTSINYSIELIKKFPKLEIYISYIDIRTPWKTEYEYKEARELGINFIRGKVGSIEKNGDFLYATIYDSLIQKIVKLKVDWIILSTAMIPSKENNYLFDQINIQTWNKGFIKGKYAKLRNIETSRNGIFACGTAIGPKLIEETINEANAVSLEIVKLFEKPEIFLNENYTIIDQEKCNGCELCARVCPFHIPYMIPKDSESEEEHEYIAVIDPFSCRGCGTCNAICPTGAAQTKNYTQKEIFAQIESILYDSDSFKKPIILGFVCDECAYASIDVLGMLRKKYPENIRFIRIPCGGRLSLLDILKGYSEGASGVFLIACGEDKCHYIDGNIKAIDHIHAAEEILQSIGWEKGRTEYFTTFVADNTKLYKKIINYSKKIELLGFNPKIKSRL